MGLKDLLVHLDSTPRSAARLELAVAMARRFGARLKGLYADVDPLGASIVAGRAPAALDEGAEAARRAFEAAVKAAGVEAEWWPVEAAAHSEVLYVAVTCCRYVDLAVVGQPDYANERAPRGLVEHVLLNSGRPVLVVPKVGHFPDAGRRIVAAWTGTQEAVRSVNDAIPLMQAADSVHLLVFELRRDGRSALPMPRLDILAHLESHGIRAKVDLMAEEEEVGSIANSLLNFSFDAGADLTVVGGYGERFPHVRVVGSTKEILEAAMPAPVLISR